MACHCLNFDSPRDFLEALQERDSDLVLKMVKCILSAYKRKKERIDIFDITFKNKSSMVFGTEKSQYIEVLNSCMDDMIALEEYELCAEIKKASEKKKRGRKPKEVII